MMRPRLGPIRTLLDATRAGQLLWAFCLLCGHARRFDPREMAWRFGAVELSELQTRFKCRRCHRRAALVVPSMHKIPPRD
jgi:hypothetical protein